MISSKSFGPTIVTIIILLLIGCTFIEDNTNSIPRSPTVEVLPPASQVISTPQSRDVETDVPSTPQSIDVPLREIELEPGGVIMLLASIRIERTEAGYNVLPKFSTMVANPEEVFIQEMIEEQQTASSIYKLELISSNGDRQGHYQALTYCPAYTDVCEALASEEMPIGEYGYLGPLLLNVSPETVRMEIFVGDQQVHVLSRLAQTPSIKRFELYHTEALENNELVQGSELNWKVETENNNQLWVTLEYRATPDRWDILMLGSQEPEGTFFISRGLILSTLDLVDLRILATDGFTTQSQVLEGALELSDKKLALEIEGFSGDIRVGLNNNIDLWFVDPETGAVCDGRGCTFGDNEGKYTVTWYSSMQTICPEDIYEGTLVYFYKSEGVHHIGATVQHIEKPYLSGEVFRDIEVGPGSLDSLDPNPDCSS